MAGTTKKATKAASKVSKASAAKTAVAKKAPAKKPSSGKAASAADASNASARIDHRIASLGDWRGERLAELRALIHAVDPRVIEEWKWMGTPVWSHDGMYVLANAHKDKVKLTFFHGAKLSDPAGLFNAGLAGGKWRAIDLREGDAIDKVALKALLREAIANAQAITRDLENANGPQTKEPVRYSTERRSAVKVSWARLTTAIEMPDSESVNVCPACSGASA